MKNYFEVLNIEATVDLNLIKKAYRDAAKKYHPDRCPGDSTAKQKFIDIQNAFEYLCNDHNRILQYKTFKIIKSPESKKLTNNYVQKIEKFCGYYKDIENFRLQGIYLTEGKNYTIINEIIEIKKYISPTDGKQYNMEFCSYQLKDDRNKIVTISEHYFTAITPGLTFSNNHTQNIRYS